MTSSHLDDRMRRAVGALAVLVVLTGCTGTQPGASEVAASAGPAASGPASPVVVEPSGPASASPDQDESPADAEIRACLEGSWLLDAARSVNYLGGIPVIAEVFGQFDAAGQIATTFTSATATSEYVGLAVDVEIEVVGVRTVQRITVDGSIASGFEVEDGVLTAHDVDVSRLDVVYDRDGQVEQVDPAPFAEPYPARVTCAETELVLQLIRPPGEAEVVHVFDRLR